MAVLANNPFPLGFVAVTTAGTPVPITANFSSLSGNAVNDLNAYANKIYFQATAAGYAMHANTGNVYIGVKGMVKATGVGVYAVLVPGASFSITEAVLGSILTVGAFWVDADNNGDGCLAFFHANQ